MVWQATQEQFRRELLNAQLLMVKGKLEVGVETDEKTNRTYKVVHVIAGHLTDLTHRLGTEFQLKSRDFH